MRSENLHKRLIEKYGPVIDLRASPDFLLDVYEELGSAAQTGSTGVAKGGTAEPFGVSWMDSWVAHWIYNEKLNIARTRDEELAAVLQGLVDLKFNERLGEIQRFIRDLQRVRAEPPDGGPPEPGTPPAGPARFVRDAPPDGGTPEPGVPPAPEPPGPPEPGVPPGPVPPVPPTGPEPARFGENPWILYWFISIKAPVLLDVIDAHITRRLNKLTQSAGAQE